MPRKNVKRIKKGKASANAQPIIIKLGRLGEEVRDWAVPKGTTVSEVLDMADIDGSVTTVKINGRKVNLNQKLTGNCTLISIPEVEGGNDEEEKEKPESEEDW